MNKKCLSVASILSDHEGEFQNLECKKFSIDNFIEHTFLLHEILNKLGQ